MTNAERDARNAKLKPKERRDRECNKVVPKQALSKALDNPFDALADVDNDTDDAGDEIDGKRARVSSWRQRLLTPQCLLGIL